MLPETITHLRDRGYLKLKGSEDVVDRTALAERCLRELSVNPVSEREQIQENALLVSELRGKLFGRVPNEDVQAELDGLISPLTGPGGMVQHALDDGLVLCTATVTRTFENDEGSITIKKPGRFITANAELVFDFFWMPGRNRLINTAASLNDRIALGIKRVPELANRRQAIVAQAHEQVQLELPETVS
jgi:hypothetical protein